MGVSVAAVRKRRARRAAVSKKAAPVNNVGQVIHFQLDGARYERRLVARPVRDIGHEISVKCPVGQALVGASAGDELWVKVPGGDKLPLRVVAVEECEGVGVWEGPRCLAVE